ncbi:hypothetical protein [Clostridium saccharobutylicum]|uniref:Uncharacterized protein n=1 Tax=Clostridium saccharobutylicum DSM 13864 TaxID=1345695 RepID=U5MTT6_CLOSA|nr:hypothetical protein [Clostridium saccharobutylicum]AGX43990.1 hypothetical protein CLSA_c30230 [Clostridium saccharobutylicum DSM 13864]MBA2905300.1 hypothetical protein [Clostridium saccharobutylicum]MBA8789873.1 hypothetical protein [Clostridium saccharobutylicum]MBA8896570.1 hypothetical protein [Clostridium saccharobutylicum]MBA8983359.1 hypothetical protein [Clostridium saccharobutylicum]
MKKFNIKGEEYRVIKDYKDFYFCVSEFGFNFKRIPKLVRVK